MRSVNSQGEPRSTVLITGAAGYVGSILTPTLLQEGHKVIAIDNFMYQQTSLLDCCYHPALKIVQGDARDRNLMNQYIEKADVLIPLACFTGAPLCSRDPIGARTTNLEAIQLILELRHSDQRIIFPTTNSGYGIGETQKACDEESPLRPISLYGKLKVQAEAEILSAGNAITVRLATVFGVSPRMRLDLLVNDFVYRAVHDGFLVLFEAHFRRNYIHVRDVARAFIHCLEHFERMKDQPYNVGLSDCNISKKQLCQEIQKQLPKFYFTEAKVGEDPDKRDYVISNAKIEGTGFSPQYSLKDGIAELIKGYQIIKRKEYANV